ncbi:hypothetical protein MTO98_30940 [Mucilaginibacter sp. SMC90]|uniref:hypothetical protein n=1 Tax=Mucilaginibacter sp. SMC90 TaxID=2929803 RepID=UPI001FB24E35|nr:hypothetical protein [Mucilaginibacter sp. SMC90]UOE48819.1 hypothetical protein MTO98_30940 [Mucilaginibacter sp. SMC90]
MKTKMTTAVLVAVLFGNILTAKAQDGSSRSIKLSYGVEAGLSTGTFKEGSGYSMYHFGFQFIM